MPGHRVSPRLMERMLLSRGGILTQQPSTQPDDDRDKLYAPRCAMVDASVVRHELEVDELRSRGSSCFNPQRQRRCSRPRRSEPSGNVRRAYPADARRYVRRASPVTIRSIRAEATGLRPAAS
jgi:hypothetical protein